MVMLQRTDGIGRMVVIQGTAAVDTVVVILCAVAGRCVCCKSTDRKCRRHKQCCGNHHKLPDVMFRGKDLLIILEKAKTLFSMMDLWKEVNPSRCLLSKREKVFPKQMMCRDRYVNVQLTASSSLQKITASALFSTIAFHRMPTAGRPAPRPRSRSPHRQ